MEIEQPQHARQTYQWDWPESGVRRDVGTVARQVLWSYAGLSLSRKGMKDGATVAFPHGRGRATPAEFGRYLRGERKIGTLERESRLQALNAPVCAHCGLSPAREMDHLIPRSRGGAGIGFNTVPCCPGCNRRRGNKDLMRWYRERQVFPTLALLRHYLKLCFHCAEHMELLGTDAVTAIAAGLPFDPCLLPSRYPPLAHLVWDWRFPDAAQE